MATLEDSRLFQELMMRLLGEDRVVISGKKKSESWGQGWSTCLEWIRPRVSTPHLLITKTNPTKSSQSQSHVRAKCWGGEKSERMKTEVVNNGAC